MQCPACPEVTLAMTHREGIEIDYCPKCRGVWLDRGELDKIIERSAEPAPAPSASRQTNPYEAVGHHKRGEPHRDDDYHGKPHKRRGLLGELFDFD